MATKQQRVVREKKAIHDREEVQGKEWEEEGVMTTEQKEVQEAKGRRGTEGQGAHRVHREHIRAHDDALCVPQPTHHPNI